MIPTSRKFIEKMIKHKIISALGSDPLIRITRTSKDSATSIPALYIETSLPRMSFVIHKEEDYIGNRTMSLSEKYQDKILPILENNLKLLKTII